MSARHYLSYTYFLKWTILNKKYYGSRIANEVEPRKDLLIKYDTSSDPVKRLLKLFGKPDVTCIDKTFVSEQKARDYEYNFLRENNCRLDPTWLNENDRPAPPIMAGDKNPSYGKIGRNSQWNIWQKTLSYEEKEKFKNDNYRGKNNPMFGKFQTKETKEKISKSVTELFKDKTKHPWYGKAAHNRKKVLYKGIIYNSRKDASIKIGVSEKTIYRWIKKGKAKYI